MYLKLKINLKKGTIQKTVALAHIATRENILPIATASSLPKLNNLPRYICIVIFFSKCYCD